MAARMSARLRSLVALALGVGLEEVGAVLPEPAVGSKVEVRRVVWGKLVAERASYLDTGYRRKQAWVGRLDCIVEVLAGRVVPKVLIRLCC